MAGLKVNEEDNGGVIGTQLYCLRSYLEHEAFRVVWW